MVKLEDDPSVSHEIDQYFADHPSELQADGSCPPVVILAYDTSFSGFVTSTLWLLLIFTTAIIVTQAMYDTLGMFTPQRLTVD